MYLRRFCVRPQIARDVRHRHLVPGHRCRRDRRAPVPGGRLLRRRLAAVSHPTCAHAAGRRDAPRDGAHRLGARHPRRARASSIETSSPGTSCSTARARAALTDFGLARGPAHTVLTRAGQQLGTIEYMAPELIRGETATRASDVYALGCVAYECLAGRSPFRARGRLPGVVRPPLARAARSPGAPPRAPRGALRDRRAGAREGPRGDGRGPRWPTPTCCRCPPASRGGRR